MRVCVCLSRLLQSRSALQIRPVRSLSSDGTFREKLRCFPGGSVSLRRQQTGVALITVSNPQRRNAFSGSMMLELEQCVSELELWADGKAVIVQGAEGNFCSGSDLNAVRALANPQDGLRMCEFMQDTLTRLLRLPLISVALLEGRALGGGAELATACDFRLMASDAVLQFVHKRMGLSPGWGGAARLVALVGHRNALKLLSGAGKVEPEAGRRMGLVDELLPCGSGDGAALALAEQWVGPFIQGSAALTRALKSVVVSGREMDMQEALRTERAVFGTLWGGKENLEALASKTKHK